MSIKHIVCGFILLTVAVGQASAATKVKVAVLKFGTVNWELNVVKEHGLDKKEQLDLDVLGLASTQATKVALQAGEVDVIVTDWLWVSRQRAAGADFSLVPYSSALGAVMVPKTSKINSLRDLKDARIGVAGGPLDKSWLIIRALSQKQVGEDPATSATPVYGAPPLLAAKARQGELDAILNYWHYSARLEAVGFRRLVGVGAAMTKFGTTGAVPMIGYTFRESWANANPQAIAAFIRATAAAREIMRTSDAEWARLKPLTKAKNDKTLVALRDRFREGIPKQDVSRLAQNAEIVFGVLMKQGGKKLLGPQTRVAPGTFWKTRQ